MLKMLMKHPSSRLRTVVRRNMSRRILIAGLCLSPDLSGADLMRRQLFKLNSGFGWRFRKRFGWWFRRRYGRR